MSSNDYYMYNESTEEGFIFKECVGQLIDLMHLYCLEYVSAMELCTLSNGHIEWQTFPHANDATIHCDIMHEINVTLNEVSCMDGLWNPPISSCQRKSPSAYSTVLLSEFTKQLQHILIIGY